MSANGLGDPAYAALVARECGALVSENEHKLYAIKADARDQWRFEPADRIAAYAKQHGMVLRGHTLLWNRDEFTPDWLKKEGFPSRAEGERWMGDYVRRVAGRYPQITSWDVVNESIDPATGEMRNSVFTRAMGPEVVELCFHAAKAAAPNARLAYNDYMGWGPGDAKHRAGVLKLLERLKSRGAPIDSFGIQGHIANGDGGDVVTFTAADQREWRAFVDEVRGMGLDLLITELDVNDRVLPADPARRDALGAALVRDFLGIMLDYPETKQVLMWGLADHHSWLQGWWPRPDGIAKRPTLYDAALKAKPMREAVAEAFRAAPERTPWA
ncbi:endo-1,4-beta-xylanase [Phenylobacterium sp. J367]|uniref:endo-1,4-beta-xylanase n=1 Tax=Phenylobacterium sp. J367 TaxID=2898435 RepID=UPI002150CC6B|nr:endo-1,4-beta-xylanase [Phenylobacterium sp. J367]MCR5878621.1 endo-1,4-beta-xylanase [Phenylobacterium sp. J367]